MRTLIMSILLASLAVPTMVQAQRLPRRSPSEQHVDEINRSLQNQGRQLENQQQNQFEINQLRQDLDRQRNFPLRTGPGTIRGCPPGSIGC